MRAGVANPLLLFSVVSLAALLLLILLLPGSDTNRLTGERSDELFMYCAAGMRKPVEEIAAMYQREYNVRVRLQYGGSNTLLSQIEVSRVGDLYLAADMSYLELAEADGLVAEIVPIATMSAVICVPQGNPQKLQSLDDLLRDDVRVALGNPDQAAIGKTVRQALQRLGKWEALESHVRETGVFKPTVNEVANDIKLGSIDAGVLWDSVAVQYPEIEVIDDRAQSLGSVEVAIGILASSERPSEALHFARYLTASDRGLPVFERLGYKPVQGDDWAEVPELTFFAGAINRRALEPILREFSEREGVEINTIYNGCGILTAQMRAMSQDHLGDFPDAFMACDRYYLDTVAELFQDAVDISHANIGILVAEGNPKGIRNLADLAKPGIRVVLGQAEQCTIGVLSQQLLKSAGIYEQVLQDNVVSQTTSSALLVPSITTGSADATLAYETDALAEQNKVDFIRVDSALARAVQPYGIARISKHKQLGKRLQTAISSSQEQFEAAGFGWQFQKPGSESKRLDHQPTSRPQPEALP
jgi:molybdenum ABC transporter molybdate-binding protein